MLIEGTRMEAMLRAIRSETESRDAGVARALILVERSSASSSIFSNLTLTSEEISAFELVQSRYKEAVRMRCSHANVQVRAVTVYLRASPETCHQRMCLRGRDVENQITVNFLRDLHRAHDAAFLKDGAADLVVDCDEKSCAEVADALCEFLDGLK
jgi:deoxyadenosine/deoxycytidine kinase